MPRRVLVQIIMSALMLAAPVVCQSSLRYNQIQVRDPSKFLGGRDCAFLQDAIPDAAATCQSRVLSDIAAVAMNEHWSTVVRSDLASRR